MDAPGKLFLLVAISEFKEYKNALAAGVGSLKKVASATELSNGTIADSLRDL